MSVTPPRRGLPPQEPHSRDAHIAARTGTRHNTKTPLPGRGAAAAAGPHHRRFEAPPSQPTPTPSESTAESPVPEISGELWVVSGNFGVKRKKAYVVVDCLARRLAIYSSPTRDPSKLLDEIDFKLIVRLFWFAHEAAPPGPTPLQASRQRRTSTTSATSATTLYWYFGIEVVKESPSEVDLGTPLSTRATMKDSQSEVVVFCTDVREVYRRWEHFLGTGGAPLVKATRGEALHEEAEAMAREMARLHEEQHRGELRALEGKIDDLIGSHEYQMGLKDAAFEAQVGEMEQRYAAQLEGVVARAEHDRQVAALVEQRRQLQEREGQFQEGLRIAEDTVNKLMADKAQLDSRAKAEIINLERVIQTQEAERLELADSLEREKASADILRREVSERVREVAELEVSLEEGCLEPEPRAHSPPSPTPSAGGRSGAAGAAAAELRALQEAVEGLESDNRQLVSSLSHADSEITARDEQLLLVGEAVSKAMHEIESLRCHKDGMQDIANLLTQRFAADASAETPTPPDAAGVQHMVEALLRQLDTPPSLGPRLHAMLGVHDAALLRDAEGAAPHPDAVVEQAFSSVLKEAREMRYYHDTLTLVHTLMLKRCFAKDASIPSIDEDGTVVMAERLIEQHSILALPQQGPAVVIGSAAAAPVASASPQDLRGSLLAAQQKARERQTRIEQLEGELASSQSSLAEAEACIRRLEERSAVLHPADPEECCCAASGRVERLEAELKVLRSELTASIAEASTLRIRAESVRSPQAEVERLQGLLQEEAERADVAEERERAAGDEVLRLENQLSALVVGGAVASPQAKSSSAASGAIERLQQEALGYKQQFEEQRANSLLHEERLESLFAELQAAREETGFVLESLRSDHDMDMSRLGSLSHHALGQLKELTDIQRQAAERCRSLEELAQQKDVLLAESSEAEGRALLQLSYAEGLLALCAAHGSSGLQAAVLQQHGAMVVALRDSGCLPEAAMAQLEGALAEVGHGDPAGSGVHAALLSAVGQTQKHMHDTQSRELQEFRSAFERSTEVLSREIEATRKELADKQDELRQAQGSADGVRHEADTLRDALAEREQENAALRGAVGAAEAAAQEEAEQRTQQTEAMSAELEHSRAEWAEAEGVLQAELAKQVQASEALRAELQTKAEAAQLGLTAEEEAHRQLAEHVASLEAGLAAGEQERAALATKHSDAAATCTALQGKVDALEAEAVQRGEACRQLEGQVGALAAELAQKAEACGSLEAQLDGAHRDKAAELQSLKAELASVAEAAQATELEAAQSRSQLEQQSGAAESAAEALADAHTQLGLKGDALVVLEAEAAQLRAELAGRAQSLAALQAELEAQAAGSASLKQQAEEDAALLRQREEELQAAEGAGRARAEALNAELLGVRAALQQQEGRLAAAQAAGTDSEQQAAAVAASLSAKEEHCEQLQSQLVAKAEVARSLRSEVNTLSADAEVRAEALCSLQKEVARVRAELAAKAASVGALEEELVAKAGDTASVQAHLRSSLAAKDASLEALRQDLAEGAADLADARANLTRERAAAATLQQELAEVQGCLGDCRSQCATLQQEASGARGAAEQVQALQGQLASATQLLDDTRVSQQQQADQLEAQQGRLAAAVAERDAAHLLVAEVERGAAAKATEAEAMEASLRAAAGSAQQKLQEAHDSLASAAAESKAQVTQLQQDLAAERSTLAEAAAKVHHLEGDLAASQEALRQEVAKVQQGQVEASATHTQLQEGLAEERRAAAARVTELEGERAAAQSAAEGAQASTGKLEAELQSVQQQLQEAHGSLASTADESKAQVAQLQQDLAAEREAHEAAQQSSSDAALRVQRLGEDVLAAQQALQQAHSEGEGARKRLAEELHDAESRCGAAEARVRSLDAEVEHLQADALRREDQLQSLRHEGGVMSAFMQSNELQLHKAELDLQSKKQLFDSVKAELDTTRADLLQTKEDLQAAQQNSSKLQESLLDRLQQAQQDFFEQQSVHTAQAEQLKETVSERDQQIHALRVDMVQATASADRLQAAEQELAALREELQASHHQVVSLQEQIGAAWSEAAEQAHTADITTQEAVSLSAAKAELEQTREQGRARLLEANQRFEVLEQQLQEKDMGLQAALAAAQRAAEATQEELKDKNQRIDDLTALLEKARASNAAAREEAESRDTAARRAHRDLERVQQDFEDDKRVWESDRHRLKKEAEDLAATAAATKQALRDRTSDLEALQEEVDTCAVRARVRMLRCESASTPQDGALTPRPVSLAHASPSVSTPAAVPALATVLDTLIEEREELSVQLATLSQERETLRKQLCAEEESAAAASGLAQRKLSTLKAELDAETETVRRHQQQLKALRAASDDTADAKAEVTRTVESLRRELETEKDTASRLKLDVAELRRAAAEHDTLRGSFETLSKRVASIAEQAGFTPPEGAPGPHVALEHLCTEVAMKGQLAEEAATLRRQSAALKCDLATLQGELEVLEIANTSLRRALDSKGDTDTSLQAAHIKLQASRADLAESRDAAAELQSQLSVLRQACDEKKRVEEELAETQQLVGTLKAELHTSRGALQARDSLEAEAQAARLKAQSLRADLDAEQEAVEGLRKTVRKLTQARDDATLTESDIKTTLERVSAQLEEAAAERLSAEADAAAHAEEAAGLRQRVAELEESAAEITLREHAVERRAQGVSEECIDLRACVGQLEKACEDRGTACCAVEEKLRDVQHASARKDAMILALEGQLAAANADVAEKHHNIAALERENADLAASGEALRQKLAPPTEGAAALLEPSDPAADLTLLQLADAEAQVPDSEPQGAGEEHAAETGLRHRLHGAECALRDKSAALEDALRQHDDLEQQLRHKAQAEQAAGRRLVEAEHQLAEAVASGEEKHRSAAALDRRLKEALLAAEGLQEEVATLQRQGRKAEGLLADARAAVDAKEAELQRALKDCDTATASVAQLERAVREKTHELDQLEGDRSWQVSALERRETHAQGLEAELAEAQAAARAKERAAEELRQECRDKAQRLAKLAEEQEAERAEALSQQGAARQLRERADELEGEREGLAAQQARLEGRLRRADDTAAALQADVDDMRQAAAVLREEKRAAQAQAAAAQTEAECAAAELSALQREVERLRADGKRATQHLRDELAESEAALQSAHAAQRSTNERLRHAEEAARTFEEESVRERADKARALERLQVAEGTAHSTLPVQEGLAARLHEEALRNIAEYHRVLCSLPGIDTDALRSSPVAEGAPATKDCSRQVHALLAQVQSLLAAHKHASARHKRRAEKLHAELQDTAAAAAQLRQHLAACGTPGLQQAPAASDEPSPLALLSELDDAVSRMAQKGAKLAVDPLPLPAAAPQQQQEHQDRLLSLQRDEEAARQHTLLSWEVLSLRACLQVGAAQRREGEQGLGRAAHLGAVLQDLSTGVSAELQRCREQEASCDAEREASLRNAAAAAQRHHRRLPSVRSSRSGSSSSSMSPSPRHHRHHHVVAFPSAAPRFDTSSFLTLKDDIIAALSGLTRRMGDENTLVLSLHAELDAFAAELHDTEARREAERAEWVRDVGERDARVSQLQAEAEAQRQREQQRQERSAERGSEVAALLQKREAEAGAMLERMHAEARRAEDALHAKEVELKAKQTRIDELVGELRGARQTEAETQATLGKVLRQLREAESRGGFGGEGERRDRVSSLEATVAQLQREVMHVTSELEAAQVYIKDTEDERAELARKAEELRCIVQLKVADDEDVEQQQQQSVIPPAKPQHDQQPGGSSVSGGGGGAPAPSTPPTPVLTPAHHPRGPGGASGRHLMRTDVSGLSGKALALPQIQHVGHP